MAVESPNPGIVGVEPCGDFRAGWHDDRIPECTQNFFAVDFQDLKVVPVQVHRVRHASAIAEINLHALTDSNVEGVTIWVSRAIDCPDISLHLAAKGNGQGAVWIARAQGFGSAEL